MATITKKLHIVAQTRTTQLTVTMNITHEGSGISTSDANAVEDALLCELSSVLDTYGYEVGIKGLRMALKGAGNVTISDAIGLSGE